MMKRSAIVAMAALASSAISLCTWGMVEVNAKATSYKLPPETAQFKPGPNLDVVKNNCTACHSADYVAMQPRGPKYRDDFWRAEVNKMINVYGASIEQADVGKIVDYIVRSYAE